MNKSITVNELNQILKKFNDTDIISVEVNGLYLDIVNIEYNDNKVIFKTN